MFWNYWWSLQSDWLLIVQFTHESHHFSKSQIAFLPGQWESFTKIQQPITFQGLFKITNQIVGKWLITFATFDKPAKYWINKILLQTKKPNIWTIECCSFKIEVIRGNWNLWHAIFIWNHSCVFTSNSHLILKSQVWFQSKYCTVLSSIAIIHCSVLLLCSWFLNTELKCSKFFLQDPCVMPDADWRRTFMAPFFTCMCLSWREQGAFMVLRSIMIKIELTEVMKVNKYFLLTPQME